MLWFFNKHVLSKKLLCFLQSLCSCGLVNELQQMMDNDQLYPTTCAYFSVLENKTLSHIRPCVTQFKDMQFVFKIHFKLDHPINET